MSGFFSHATPIWVFALWTPFYSFWCFHMAIKEFTEVAEYRSMFRAAAYLGTGVISALSTPLIIAVPWLT
ncbi:MAG: hypothetical protein EPO08_21410 [Rhodospirillaceae bacterium]|nr:MAG: hypothetical protein EPO08_21410 [Rhodospirillaceae bacterium]